MKWFRHMTNASDDAFIEELEELFGWEGYGRWWKLLEIIASDMKEGDPSATHSWVKWQSFLKGKRNKLETFLKHCENKSRIKLEQNGNILKITLPKLLELKDEYTRKSGQAPEKIRKTSIIDTDTDTESKKKKEKKVNIPSQHFDELWEAYKPTRGTKKEAMKAYTAAIKAGADHAEIINGARKSTEYHARAGTQPRYIKHLSSWLNADGWTADYSLDEPKHGNHHGGQSKFMAGVAALFEDEGGGDGSAGLSDSTEPPASDHGGYSVDGEGASAEQYFAADPQQIRGVHSGGTGITEAIQHPTGR